MPGVIPTPLGASVCAKIPVLFSSDPAKLLHSGSTVVVNTTRTAPVNLAGGSGATGTPTTVSPLACCCQLVSKLEAAGWPLGTVAFAKSSMGGSLVSQSLLAFAQSA